MCTKIWRQQYEPTCLTEEEVDDMMLEITGGVDGDIEVATLYDGELKVTMAVENTSLP